MDKYRRVEKVKEEADGKNDEEIRLTAQGSISAYVGRAGTVFNELEKQHVLLKATGGALTKAVTTAEVIKRRFKGLHQITKIGAIELTDEYMPLEEGLEIVFDTRSVPFIEITLSKEALDTSDMGYQPPIDESLVKDVDPEEISKGRGRGKGGGRGKGKGDDKGKGKGKGKDDKGKGKGKDDKGKGKGKSDDKGKGKGKGKDDKGKGKGKSDDKGKGKGKSNSWDSWDYNSWERPSKGKGKGYDSWDAPSKGKKGGSKGGSYDRGYDQSYDRSYDRGYDRGYGGGKGGGYDSGYGGYSSKGKGKSSWGW